MPLIVGKLALLAGVAFLTLGIYPDRLRGGIIAIAICIAAAVALRLAAP
jgi:hypothetical protein